MANNLTFGYLYELRNPPEWERPWAELYADALDFAVWSEELGFDGAWVPEHHATNDGFSPAPLAMLAALAGRTRRMKLGTAVALAPFYHPVRFAEDCAVIDVISNGRLEIGLALGYRRKETEAYGIEFATRPSKMDEFLQIVRALWAGETVTFKGRHYDIRNAALLPAPVRGHIPLFVGGYSEKALGRVARYADGYFGDCNLYETYRAQLVQAGRDPAAGRFYQASVPLVVAEDPEAAIEELAPYFHYVNNMYGVWLGEDGYKDRVKVDQQPKTMSLGEFKQAGLLHVLTPAAAIDFFRTMRAKAPVEHVTINVPPGMPLNQFAKYAELFANTVIPAFR